jgi:hypothetical protein
LKNLIYYIILILVGAFLFSCEVDYFSDPNRPEIAPTYGIMNRVQKQFINDTRDEWFSGRQMLLWVQYWNQVNYTEEDRFQYRETVNQSAWDDIYGHAQDLQDIITLNTDEATASEMEKYGPNENQIAAARIMLTYVYLHAVELWGDVPYWSYGSSNESFQANQLKEGGIDQPVYAKHADIYADMLKELDEAQAMINVNALMIDGDNFFGGDAMKWKKFANSLRLRIANRVNGTVSGADAHITAAISAGVMESNGDNAGVAFEANALNGAPMFRAFVVSARKDFAPSLQFVELLKGNRGPFGVEDPRLDIYVADNADGLKLGIPLTEANDVVGSFAWESMPGDAILASDYTELYMEYAEVCFLLSEVNGWDQDWYEKGVAASMERWGVAQADVDAYVAALPAATEETVMMQKYIALYMQPMEAWSEYRRTGYPNTLIKANEPYTYEWTIAGKDTSSTYEFKPIGGLTDLPERNKYLLNEASINNDNVKAAGTSMGGDAQDSKLIWAK